MKLFIYFITALIFIGPVILAKLHFPVEGDMVKDTVRMYPAFYILFFYMFIRFTKGELIRRKNDIYAIVLVALTFCGYIFLRIFTGHGSKSFMFNCLALPALYALFYAGLRQNTYTKRLVRNCVIFMFVFNCLFAVYERLTLKTFFPVSLIHSHIEFVANDWRNADVFRSSALVGHPLSNALLMAVVMGFLLVSDLKAKYKYTLLLLGFFSLFCFNARGSILFSALFVLIYYLFPRTSLPKREMRKRWIGGIVFIGICAIAATWLFQNEFGGRFFERDLDEDGSILARLEVFDILTRYGWEFFLTGVSDIEDITISTLGYNHVENWFILGIMQVGLVTMVPAILLFIPVFRQSLTGFTLFESIVVLGLCFCVSSTNNSLACGVQALSTFFACAFAFGRVNQTAPAVTSHSDVHHPLLQHA